MNSMLTNFYKFAEHHTVAFNSDKTSYCTETGCAGCVLETFCTSGENIGLTKDDIQFIKQTNPEYFI